MSGDEDKTAKRVEVKRHNVDRLFRDIIGTVNQVASVGWLAWFFVRVGWLLGVKYKDESFAGKAPIWVITTSAICVFLLGDYLIDNWEFQRQKFEFLVTLLIMLYLLFYIATLIVLRIKSSRVV